jgi:anti-sigma factor RsiW
MCEMERKLIAWMDRELAADEAAAVERHLDECEACRERLAKYKNVSETFASYCDAVFVTATKRIVPIWVPALASAAMLAGVGLLFLMSVLKRIEPIAPTRVSVLGATTAPQQSPAKAAPQKTTQNQHRIAPVARKMAPYQQGERVEIAIPAEAIFAPGTVPEGMTVIAEMRIAPDGSVQYIRIRQ